MYILGLLANIEGMSRDMFSAHADNSRRVAKADYYAKLTVKNAVLSGPFAADRSWFGMQGCILSEWAWYAGVQPRKSA